MRLNKKTLPGYLNRLSLLNEDAQPRFGTLTATSMARHLRHTLEASMGDVQTPDNSVPVLRHIQWFVGAYVFRTLPPGKVRAPEWWMPSDTGDFESERELLREAMIRFVDTLEREPGKKTNGNIIGPTSVRRWSASHGVHFNHHFKQFGV